MTRFRMNQLSPWLVASVSKWESPPRVDLLLASVFFYFFFLHRARCTGAVPGVRSFARGHCSASGPNAWRARP